MSKLALEEEWSSVIAELRSTRDAAEVLGPLRRQGLLGAEDALKLWQLSLQAEDQRRAGGVYYTDYAEALTLAERVLARFDAFPTRVLEPSCGGGNLIAALLEAGVARFGRTASELASAIHAFELDASGLWLAQWTIDARLGEGVSAQLQWELADTLEALTPVSRDAGDTAAFDFSNASEPVGGAGDAKASSTSGDAGRYALIFGNPPFGNAIESSTRRSKTERASYAARYPLATRGAFDKCALFVELAAQRCAPDGHISYILPRSWLAQPASQMLRAQLAKDFHLLEIADLPSQAFFDASVATVALTLVRRSASEVPKPASSKALTRTALASKAEALRSTLVLKPDLPATQLDATALLLEGSWGAALHPFATNLVQALDELPLLASRVEFSAGASTEEAYAWVEHLTDIGPLPCETAAALSPALPPNRSAQLYALADTNDLTPPIIAQPDRKTRDDEPSDAEKLDAVKLSERASGAQKPLVIAGMVDPFELYWGTRPTRYLRQDYDRPMAALDGLRPARHDRSGTARALLPTLSHALEAWPDLDGAVVGAVSTISAWVRLDNAPEPPSPHAQRQTLILCAVLNSAWMRLQYSCLFSALALNGGNTQVSKNKLAALRAPQAWLTLLDPAPCPTADLPRLQRRLTSLPSTLLSKKLPSLETLAVLQTHASELRESFSAEALGAGLVALLERDAKAALQAGHLDLILLALAPELLLTPGD